MTVTLRDYQIACIDGIRKHARERPVLVVPVGGGKTTIAAEIIRRATANGQRTLFIAHRRELIDQAVARLAKFGIRAGVIMGGRLRTESPVQVASIDTLKRRAFVPADLVIYDEAHHARAEGAQRVLAAYPNAILIGLTATPFRTDGKGLGYIFGSIVAPVTVRELIQRGVILEPRVFGPDITAELKGLHTVAGDYNQRELGERMNQRRLVGDIVDHWLEAAGPNTPGGAKRTICFAVNKNHSRAITEQFLARGIPAEHVEDKTKNRAEIFARLAQNEIHVVSNCGITTEGWDLPSVEVVILARPTKSLGLHIQTVGRGMRADPENPAKQCIVLDHAGNHLTHGMVIDEIEYSLEDQVKKKPGAPSVRQCPKCFAIYSGGPVCPECGHAPEAATTAPIEHTPGKLVELTAGVEREAWYAQQIERVSRYGQRLGKARILYKEKFGTYPRHYELERKLYRCPGHVEELTDYGKRCRNCYQKINADRRTLPRKGSRIRAVLDSVFTGDPVPDIPSWQLQRDYETLHADGFLWFDRESGRRVISNQWVDAITEDHKATTQSPETEPVNLLHSA